MALRAKDFDKALELSRAALRRFPNNPQLWVLQGVAMVNKGENQKRIDVIPACAEVELELPVPLRPEAVDEQHPKLAAFLRGSLVLFAISDGQPTFDRAELLRAQFSSTKGEAGATTVDGSRATLKPFLNIDEENYSTYVLLKT